MSYLRHKALGALRVPTTSLVKLASPTITSQKLSTDAIRTALSKPTAPTAPTATSVPTSWGPTSVEPSTPSFRVPQASLVPIKKPTVQEAITATVPRAAPPPGDSPTLPDALPASPTFSAPEASAPTPEPTPEPAPPVAAPAPAPRPSAPMPRPSAPPGVYVSGKGRKLPEPKVTAPLSPTAPRAAAGKGPNWLLIGAVAGAVGALYYMTRKRRT
jgi:hypothetical protein